VPAVGYSVKYVEADTDFAKFGLATLTEQAKILSTYTDPDLLVLDDLFLARRIAMLAPTIQRCSSVPCPTKSLDLVGVPELRHADNLIHRSTRASKLRQWICFMHSLYARSNF
jgi:hypothetical protein